MSGESGLKPRLIIIRPMLPLPYMLSWRPLGPFAFTGSLSENDFNKQQDFMIPVALKIFQRRPLS